MKNILIIFHLFSFIFSIGYDFIINKEITNDYITVIDENAVGKWNLKAKTNSSNRVIISNYDSFIANDESMLISSNETIFFDSLLEEIPFNINVDLTSFKNSQSISEIKLFIKLTNKKNKNHFEYSFTGECELNDIRSYADISYKASADKNELEISNVEEIQDFYVDPLCFDDKPRKNAKTFNLTFINKTANKTNINLFSECGEDSQKYIYDFSDYPDHGGRKINLKPNKSFTFKIDEASWKKLKYRFTDNKKTLKDGQYVDLDIKKIKKRKNIEIEITEDLVKEYFGTKESYTLAYNDFNLNNDNDITYILDKVKRNPKDNSEYGIKSNKISFPTGNVNNIRHLTINGVPAIINENNKTIEKAKNPVLVIIDFNGIRNRSDAKNGNEFLGIIREIYNLTKNSNYHIYKYLNQYPYENNEDYMFGSNEYSASNFGLTKIYLLDFDETDGSVKNFKDNKTVINSNFPYINEQNYTAFHDYMKEKKTEISKIKKRGIWSFEPILSYESLNYTGTTSDVNEKISLSSYLNTFRNTVLNTDVGSNSILPSSGPSNFKKIYYVTFNEPSKEVDFEKDYTINFISYKNYKEILK